MTVYFPEHDAPALAQALSRRSGGRLVACLCADWCGTCKEYLAAFRGLAERSPDDCFVWVDIETHADRLGDLDIENFPTVLVQRIGAGEPQFYGTLLPHIETLERMLARGGAMHVAADEAPDLLGWLAPDGAGQGSQ
jgi:thiol-disulfide isomerase/thioredoxin